MPLVADIPAAVSAGLQLRQAQDMAPIQQQAAQLGLEKQQQNLQLGGLQQQNIQQQMDIRSDDQKTKSLYDVAFKVLSASDDQVIPILEEQIKKVQSYGGNPAESIRALELARTGDIKAVKDGANNIIDIGVRQGDLKAEEKGQELTSKQRDFNTYQELLKTDKDKAEVFGRGAGFIKDDSKRLFKLEKNQDGSKTKVFSDGTTEEFKPADAVKTPDMNKSMSTDEASEILGGAKEYQVKAAGFAMRLRDSIDNMEKLTTGVDGEKVDPAKAALINKALADGTLANMSLSEGEQQYIVEAKDALFAILRPETGAAITDSEMAQYSKIYLPQPGDTEGVTKTKKRKMENQFLSLRGRAPSVYDATRVTLGLDNENSSTQKVKDWSEL